MSRQVSVTLFRVSGKIFLPLDKTLKPLKASLIHRWEMESLPIMDFGDKTFFSGNADKEQIQTGPHPPGSSH